MEFLFKLILLLIAVFMILLILVQRGKGGGLAGALGGPGGSSAFGAKAGDVFTKITAYTALIWMFVCICASLYFSNGRTGATAAELEGMNKRVTTSPADSGAGAGAGTGAATETEEEESTESE